jgi:hypothetical protein
VFLKENQVSDSYFVVSTSDGDVYFEQIDEQELLKRFNPKDDDRYYGDRVPTAPTEKSINLHAEGGFFIIKGDFVTLKPKEVVQEWEIA